MTSNQLVIKIAIQLNIPEYFTWSFLYRHRKKKKSKYLCLSRKREIVMFKKEAESNLLIKLLIDFCLEK